MSRLYNIARLPHTLNVYKGILFLGQNPFPTLLSLPNHHWLSSPYETGLEALTTPLRIPLLEAEPRVSFSMSGFAFYLLQRAEDHEVEYITLYLLLIQETREVCNSQDHWGPGPRGGIVTCNHHVLAAFPYVIHRSFALFSLLFEAES